MSHPSGFVLQLIDPRGRCSRKGLLCAAAVLLALQVPVVVTLWLSGIGLTGHTALILDLAFCWIGFAIVAKRLHDLGHSAWWVPAAVLVWFAGTVSLAVAVILVGDPELMQPGTTSYWVVFALMLAPLLIAALWLHLAEGDANDNRFGPVPGTSGFSMPSDAGQWLRHTVGPRPSAA